MGRVSQGFVTNRSAIKKLILRCSHQQPCGGTLRHNRLSSWKKRFRAPRLGGSDQESVTNRRQDQTDTPVFVETAFIKMYRQCQKDHDGIYIFFPFARWGHTIQSPLSPANPRKCVLQFPTPPAPDPLSLDDSRQRESVGTDRRFNPIIIII